MIPICFQHTRLPCRSVEDGSRLLNCRRHYREQSENIRLKAPSHLTECRRTKGDEWEKSTKCTRIQRIQTEFPSNHAISNYCKILSTNDKRRINITCE